MPPGSNIKRCDLAVALVRALRLLAENTKNEFSDVPEDAYYAEAVQIASALGAVKGYNNAFSPNRPITRGEIEIIFGRLGYEDVLTDKTRPNDSLTRAETAVIIYRILTK